MTAPVGRDVTALDGGRHGPGACVLAPNPSLMTLNGTNTWLIAEPGAASAVRG